MDKHGLNRIDVGRTRAKDRGVPIGKAERRNIGKKLRALREDRGWYQEHVAKKSGLSRSSVFNIEHGRAHVRHDMIEKYAAVFGLGLVELLHEERHPLDAHLKGINVDHLTIAHGYKDARTTVRQAIEAVLAEHTGYALAQLVVGLAPRLLEDPGLAARVRQVLETPATPDPKDKK